MAIIILGMLFVQFVIIEAYLIVCYLFNMDLLIFGPCNSQIVHFLQQHNVNSCNRSTCLSLCYNESSNISKLPLLATLNNFVVKGDNIYNSGVGIGELLFCELEHENLFNIYGSALKVVKRNGNEDQIIGHLPDPLAEKIALLMRQDFLKSETTGERVAAPEGMWTQDGDINTNKYK